MRREGGAGPEPSAGRYERYISSREWRESPARLLELSLSGGRCRVCGRGAPEVRIEVHHRSYARLGREGASDLCTLCSECHEVNTAELRRRRYATAAVPVPRDVRRATPAVELRDRTDGERGRLDG